MNPQDIKDQKRAEEIAEDLLSIQAIFFRPQEPFIWASGIKSPIYCDNRLILTAPAVRNRVEAALKEMIEDHYPDVEILMGTATAGIAHAAITAHLMGIPMGYVRSKAKDHGRKNQIEGELKAGEKVVVVEDLISTGGSIIDVVNTVRKAGGDVLGLVSLFTYNMRESKENFERAGVSLYALSNFDAAMTVAQKRGELSPIDIEKLKKFRDQPRDESWIHA